MCETLHSNLTGITNHVCPSVIGPPICLNNTSTMYEKFHFLATRQKLSRMMNLWTKIKHAIKKQLFKNSVAFEMGNIFQRGGLFFSGGAGCFRTAVTIFWLPPPLKSLVENAALDKLTNFVMLYYT